MRKDTGLVVAEFAAGHSYNNRAAQALPKIVHNVIMRSLGLAVSCVNRADRPCRLHHIKKVSECQSLMPRLVVFPVELDEPILCYLHVFAYGLLYIIRAYLSVPILRGVSRSATLSKKSKASLRKPSFAAMCRGRNAVTKSTSPSHTNSYRGIQLAETG